MVKVRGACPGQVLAWISRFAVMDCAAKAVLLLLGFQGDALGTETAGMVAFLW